MSDKNRKTRKFANKGEVIVHVLRQHGAPIEIGELAELAQQLHPIPTKVRGWRVGVLEETPGAFLYKKAGKEFAVLHEWVRPDLAAKARQTTLPTKHSTLDSAEDATMADNGVPIIRPDARRFFLKKCPDYVEVDQEIALIQAHLDSGQNLNLEGPKGIGKTLALARFAFEQQIPIFQFDCSENTKRRDLIGRFTLVGDQVKYILGALPTAIDVANQSGACLLVLEELNALEPQMQKVLNQLLDWRRQVYIPELNKTYRLNDGVKLLVAGTMNPSFYGGVHELNEDLKSRFATLKMTYPHERDEREIINVHDGVEAELREKLITFATETRAGAVSGDCDYAISPRDIHQFLTNLEAYSQQFSQETAFKKALTTSFLGKYDAKDEQDFIKKRIVSVFGVYL